MDDVGDGFRNLQFHLFHRFAVFNNVYRSIGVNKAEEVVVDINNLIDLDDVLLAHFQTEGIHNEGHIVVGVFQMQVVKYGHAISGFDMVDDNTSFYTVDF